MGKISADSAATTKTGIELAAAQSGANVKVPIDSVLKFAALESVSAASIAAIGNAINTANKFAGRMVWDTTNTRIMVASGSAAADPWKVADNSASVTPS